MTFFSVCKMSFGRTNTQPNGQKLGSAPRQRALSNCPCSAADFGEEPNCNKPPTTLSTRSHSMQILSLLKVQDRTQTSLFYICRKNSTEYCSMSQIHIKRKLPETLSTMAGCWSKLYVQMNHASRLNELHFIQVHFNMDYDHVPETIQSSHTTHSNTCL